MALVTCRQGAERVRAEGASCGVRIRAAVQKAGLKAEGPSSAEHILASVRPGGQAVGFHRSASLICRPVSSCQMGFCKMYLS